MVSNRRWLPAVQAFLGVTLGLGLLGWFLSDVHWSDVAEVLRHVSFGWVAVAAALMLADIALQGWRWGFLLRHVDPKLDLKTLWDSTAVMWSFNTLLPLRAGNVIRPALVARKRDLPFATVLFTTVADYLCDVFGILLLVLVTASMLPESAENAKLFADLRRWAPWLAAVGFVGFVLAVLLSSRGGGESVRYVTHALPGPVRRRVLEVFDQLVAGMAAVGDPLRFGQALGATVLVWAGWWVTILALFRAFSLDVPPVTALFLETALTLAMLAPQAPGFLGVFQVVTEEALRPFGTTEAQGEAIALVFWLVCFVPVTVYGLYVASREGFTLRGGRAQVLDAAGLDAPPPNSPDDGTPARR